MQDFDIIYMKVGIVMFWEYENETSKSKKGQEKVYDKYVDDPITFALDEALGILGPHKEKLY